MVDHLFERTPLAHRLEQATQPVLTRMCTAQVAGEHRLGGGAVGIDEQHRTRPRQREAERGGGHSRCMPGGGQHDDRHQSARFTTTSRPAAASLATSSLAASATVTSNEVLPSGSANGATETVA